MAKQPKESANFGQNIAQFMLKKRRLLPGIIVHAFKIICQAVYVNKDVSKHQKMYQKELNIIQIHCKIVIFAPNIAQFMLKRWGSDQDFFFHAFRTVFQTAYVNLDL